MSAAPLGQPRPDGLFLASVPSMALLVGGLVLLVLSALPVDKHAVGGLEARVFREVNDGIRLPWFAVWTVMQLGSVIVIPLVAGGALLARRPRLAATAVVAGAVAYAMGKVVRHVVPRPRPARLLAGVIVRGSPALGSGYLSGHTALAVAMAVVLTPYLGRTGRWVVWVVALLVGGARMYAGAHLPLDVVGGAALGLATGGAVSLVGGRIRAARSAPSPSA
ncbi:MAG TPA: phosphatase PAP2 family protein [Acidimicrobiales bacterium]|nr:phosphatase PAP2 family protein [Acidimicrobiales bacterium]